MDKEKLGYYEILNKIFACLIIIIALLAMNLIYNVAGGGSTTKSTTDEESTSENANYDTSDLNQVDAAGAIKLFDSKDPQVILFGRPDCGVCVSFLPIIKEAQEDLGFVTNYVDINEVEQDDTLNELLDMMDVKTTVNLNGEDEEGTFGEFYGLTPTVIIVKDGKMKAGIVGYKSYNDYVKFLNDNGIEAAK